MTVEFKLPDLGENIEGGDVVSVLVAEGDTIEAEQNVLELETEKAIAELPCPHAGRVKKIHVSPGDSVKIGDLVLTLEPLEAPAERAEGAPAAGREEARRGKPAAADEEREPARGEGAEAPVERGEAPVERPRAREAEVRPRKAAAPVAEPPSVPGEGPPPAPAGPATRRLARELGVDLHSVQGTGPAGRITRDDLKEFVRTSMRPAGPAALDGAAAPALPDFSQWGEVETEPLKGIRRKTAESTGLAWRLIPHVTQFDRADITELEAARRAYEKERTSGAKVTVTVLALKASVAALKAFPQFNASLDVAAGRIILKRYYHIGIAVDTEHGLLVPVVRDADKKSIEELALEVADLASRARERKLDLDEMRGASFTITNLGGIGGLGFTPIVNHPEVAILGIARSQDEVVLRDGKPEARRVLPLSLSYDHRVIDGADGARFLSYLAGLLTDPFRLLLNL